MTTTISTPVANQTTAKETVPPKVDIFESPTEIVLYAEMPGVDESSVDISLEDHVLSIKGETQEPHYEGYTPCRIETSYPNYERRFKIHELIEIERIEASLKDGVLKVQLPKTKPLLPKKIVVQKR
ncbi:MAG: Hsp20/alpha crystallin family protein [Planctomycetota bacterium]|nr:Hsp20/alpha crystallin family protein [Planctomycetota bacterium]MDA1212347.1 Hsp20/alpha crystallin family protein [Planctomycetota bacterium]